MEKLIGIRLVCTKSDCHEIIAEYDILKEDAHSYRISMADNTGEADERSLKKKWIGEITEYELADGVEFKIMCLLPDKKDSIAMLHTAALEYVERLRTNLTAIESVVQKHIKKS